MDAKDSITFGFLISRIGVIFTAINFFIARRKDIQNTTSDSVKEQVENRFLIQQVLEQTKEIKADTKSMKEDIKALTDKWHEVDKSLSEVKKEQQTMWKRIDELNGNKYMRGQE